MTTIVISGYYGFDNLGDEAILTGILSSLRRVKSSDLKIVVLSANPLKTIQRYGVTAINRNNPLVVLNAIFNCDLLLSGGGSLLQDMTGYKSIPYYLGLVYLAQLMGKKTVFYAQGIGPLTKKISKKLLRLVASRVDLITVRDQQSRKLLKDMIINGEKIIVTADPVFALSKQSRKQIVNETNKSNAPLIGVSVRPWGDNSYLQTLGQLIDYLVEISGGRVLIINLYPEQDYKLAVKLAQLIKTGCYILPNIYSPREMLAFFSRLDFVVGVRLHSLIFAAVNLVPFLGIIYDPKVRSLLAEFNFGYGIEIDNIVRQNNFQQLVAKAWNERDKLKNELKEVCNDFKKKTRDNAEMVMRVCRGSH